MSIEATSWALQQRCPTATSKLVLLGLASHARADGSAAWPGVETLAVYACCDRRTVQRSLRALESAGFIAPSDFQPAHLPADRRPVAYDVLIAGRRDAAPEQERGGAGDVDGAAPVSERGGAGAARTVSEPSASEPSPSTSDVPSAGDEPPADPLVEWPPVVRELVQEFARFCLANGHTIPKRGTSAATGWLREMDRLLRLGPPGDSGGAPPPPPEEVRMVMRYAMNDVRDGSGFPGWGAVIRSVGKFREQYSRLRIEAKRASGNGSRNGQALAAGYAAAAEELRARQAARP